MTIAHRCLASLLVFFALLPVTLASAQEHPIIRTGRYSSVALKPLPAQINPLQATVTVEIPGVIQTVGQAIGYSLRNSGYRLAPVQAADPTLGYLFDLTLPQIHRSLGPLSLSAVLTTLAGPAYRLVTDPVHRLVSFELKAVYRLLDGPSLLAPGILHSFRELPSPCAVTQDSEGWERDLTVAFAHRCYLLPLGRVVLSSNGENRNRFSTATGRDSGGPLVWWL